MGINKNLIAFFRANSNPRFINYFYGISINDQEKKSFKDYSKVVLYRNEGLSASRISKLANLPKRKIEHWIYEGNKPFVIRLLEKYLHLGNPKSGFQWLSVNSTRGGLFTGPWIQVPFQLKNIDDIYLVLEQSIPLPEYITKSEAFNTELQNCQKEHLFAYLLGFIVGDASKTGIKRKQRTTRRIHIRLSVNYPTNLKLGNYASLCANGLGLRMGRRKNCPAGKLNPHPFYTWISQSSSFFQWIFHTCLGLQDHETTTYNPIRAKWLLSAPKEFKIAFLQGLADSDGFVDFNSQQIGIITEPNTQLVKEILDSIKIHSTPKLFTQHKLWALMINIKDAYNLPLFNPIVKSYRYQDTEKLFKATQISGHWPEWLRLKVEYHIKQGLRGTKLMKKVLDEEGIAITTKHIRRHVKLTI